MTYLLGESPHTPREQPVESAGIPDLPDYGRVHVGPANVSSGSHATNTKTEEADAVRVRRSSLMSVDGLEHKVSVEQAASNGLEFRIDKFTNHVDLSKELKG
jgi:hypothetical protein